MTESISLPPISRKPNPISRELAISLIPRVMKRMEVHPETGCWIRGHRTYTTLNITEPGRHWWAQSHRIMYVAVFGEIPENYTIDHLCEVPACVNPMHLSAVTHRDNVLRSETNPFAINARSGECPEGHPMPERVRKSGRPPGCPICKRRRERERGRARYRRKKLQQQADALLTDWDGAADA